ncbi:MAG TPA: phosphatidylserine decarboxylase, partial [Candidatus Deferrimicrobium sp.]|nr:phosphatidylserine decarboxylase [Candidatus Deferrimicrobium sp.]
MSRIVLTIGCFDLFHYGHKNLFSYMARLGDEIVVGIHDKLSTYVNKGVQLIDPFSVRRNHILNQSKVKRIFIVKKPDPSDALKNIIKEYKAKGHKIVYVRGNDWSDFPGREVLEKEGVPIVLKEYTNGISSSKLRKRLDAFVQAIYNALTDEEFPDEDIISLFEDALFVPSDAVMRKLYQRLYDEGCQEVFGKRFLQLSKLIGKVWNRPESKSLIPRFIRRMDVNTKELDMDPSEFPSLNSFFARSVNLSKRPFENGVPDLMNVCSPSDGLILVFKNSDKAKEYYIKGKSFSLPALLDYDESLISMVKGGPMVILRLRPRDIHRMYAPFPGRMGELHRAGNRLHTVKSEIVARPDVDVFTENMRLIIPYHETPMKTYLFIAIGAPLINSIVLHSKPGDLLDQGQELGYFQYGGSTIILLFPPEPRIEWR